MSEPVLQPTSVPVAEFLATVPERRQPEADVLIDMMRQISGEAPQMWGPSIIGFGEYHYRYANGRTGTTGRIGFSPRKAKLSIYFIDGLANYTDLLERLGKHTTAVSCLYVNKLADIDLDVLREMLVRCWQRAGELDARGHADPTLRADRMDRSGTASTEPAASANPPRAESSRRDTTYEPAPANNQAAEAATGISWPNWLAFFAQIGASELDHTQIAQHAAAHIREHGECSNPDWWAQHVTIAYEQQTGRRKPGQRCDGNFSVSASKTLPGEFDALWQRWQEFMRDADSDSVSAREGDPTVSATDTWRYWRASFADGSRTVVNFRAKSAESPRTVMQVQQDKIVQEHEVVAWRSYWKGKLAEFAAFDS